MQPMLPGSGFIPITHLNDCASIPIQIASKPLKTKARIAAPRGQVRLVIFDEAPVAIVHGFPDHKKAAHLSADAPSFERHRVLPQFCEALRERIRVRTFREFNNGHSLPPLSIKQIAGGQAHANGHGGISSIQFDAARRPAGPDLRLQGKKRCTANDAKFLLLVSALLPITISVRLGSGRSAFRPAKSEVPTSRFSRRGERSAALPTGQSHRRRALSVLLARVMFVWCVFV
jgi:hypothetical protein